MSRVAYVDGRYVPHAAARVSIDDRGYQFADSIYEVCEIRGGAAVDLVAHLDRMDRSLSALGMASPMSRAALTAVLGEVIRRNKVRNGHVYWQVSRGVARRDHGFPPDARPILVITAKPGDPAAGEARAVVGVKAVTAPDERWARVDIKTTGLLPNVLAKQAARAAGAYEAILVDGDGLVTEGSSTNVWIVDGEGRLRTRPLGPEILPGVSRARVMQVARALNHPVEERAFSVEDLKRAREVFITSAGNVVMPVVEIDGTPVANGVPGSVALSLRAAFHAHAPTVSLKPSSPSLKVPVAE